MKKQYLPHHGRGVEQFLACQGDKVTGVLSGFDRVRLQGSLRGLYASEVFEQYLRCAKVLFKDYKEHVIETTKRICAAARQIAEAAGTTVLERAEVALEAEAPSPFSAEVGTATKFERARTARTARTARPDVAGLTSPPWGDRRGGPRAAPRVGGWPGRREPRGQARSARPDAGP